MVYIHYVYWLWWQATASSTRSARVESGGKKIFGLEDMETVWGPEKTNTTKSARRQGQNIYCTVIWSTPMVFLFSGPVVHYISEMWQKDFLNKTTSDSWQVPFLPGRPNGGPSTAFLRVTSSREGLAPYDCPMLVKRLAVLITAWNDGVTLVVLDDCSFSFYLSTIIICIFATWYAIHINVHTLIWLITAPRSLSMKALLGLERGHWLCGGNLTPSSFTLNVGNVGNVGSVPVFVEVQLIHYPCAGGCDDRLWLSRSGISRSKHGVLGHIETYFIFPSPMPGHASQVGDCVAGGSFAIGSGPGNKIPRIMASLMPKWFIMSQVCFSLFILFAGGRCYIYLPVNTCHGFITCIKWWILRLRCQDFPAFPGDLLVSLTLQTVNVKAGVDRVEHGWLASLKKIVCSIWNGSKYHRTWLFEVFWFALVDVSTKLVFGCWTGGTRNLVSLRWWMGGPCLTAQDVGILNRKSWDLRSFWSLNPAIALASLVWLSPSTKKQGFRWGSTGQL